MRLRSFLLGIILLSFSTLTYSTDQFSLDDYFNQVSLKSKYDISPKHRKILKNYYHENKLSPENFLDKETLKIRRQSFNGKRLSLMKSWIEETGKDWPTYGEDTLCKINGDCYWKYCGDFYDAHHIFPLSHKGPNVWQNILPLATDAHTSLHVDPGPCCSIFPKSCGSRGMKIETEDYFTGWSKNNKSRSRKINEKDVIITKVQTKSSKHYYRIKVDDNAGGESYETLKAAQKVAIAQAFKD